MLLKINTFINNFFFNKKMRIPKKYGAYKTDKCPFCDKQATTMNFQSLPVCQNHKNEELPLLKCQCSGFLDLKSGKFGSYFNCFKCGNINFKRAMELNEDLMKEHNKSISNNVKSVKSDNTIKKPKSAFNKIKNKETTITSDMIDAYYS
jgi:hypothetical protein